MGIVDKKKKEPKTVYGIQCPLCKEKLYSRHQHDMRYCTCKYCYVDGGREYTRVGYGLSYSIGSDYLLQNQLANKLIGQPKSVRIRIK